ncbi:MAG TPA: hypothetical protein VFX53_05025 [Pedococcus sp.]|nr:hypothetical protein [Pedococcus sp.]
MGKRSPFKATATLLTDTEHNILILASYGLTNQEIDERLHVQSSARLRRAFRALRAHDRAHAVRRGFELGILNPGDTAVDSNGKVINVPSVSSVAPPNRRIPARCGTPHGHQVHRRNDEPICEECAEARRDYDRSRKRTPREKLVTQIAGLAAGRARQYVAERYPRVRDRLYEEEKRKLADEPGLENMSRRDASRRAARRALKALVARYPGVYRIKYNEEKAKLLAEHDLES